MRTTRTLPFLCYLSACTLAAQVPKAHGQCEIDRLTVAGGDDCDFGRSVAMTDQVLVTGEPVLGKPGRVHVYRLDGDGWIHEAELQAPDGNADDSFGGSVAISDDVIVVGAYAINEPETETGAAYIYRYEDTTWHLEARLAASDGDRNDQFGHAVAIDGSIAFVSAWTDEGDPGYQFGSVYVFRRIDGAWVEEAKLNDPEGEECDLFGVSVAVSGDVGLIGAHGNSDAGAGTGAAFLFRYRAGKWHFEQQLRAFDAMSQAWFGFSVDLAATRAVVGAPEENGQIGAAYTFRYVGSQWIDEQKLVAAHPVGPGPRAGRSVKIAEDERSILMGAPDDRELGTKAGAAHVFVRDGVVWTERAKLLPSDGSALFGTSAAISDDLAAIGAPGNNRPGATYLVAGIRPDDCNDNGVPDGCDIVEGTSDDSDGDGVPDECQPTGDVNGDGRVGLEDLLILLQTWGECPAPPDECPADLDRDGVVAIADLLILLKDWG